MMRKKKICAFFLCAILTAAFLCSCAKKEPTFILSQTNIQIKSGETSILTVSLANIGSDPYGITWESNNTEVATVANGKVTGVSSGSAIIKARITVYSNSKTLTGEVSCTVTVMGEAKLESLSFSNTSRKVAPGSTLLLVPESSPTGASAKLLWTSSNEEIATVDDNGLVTAHKEGAVTIIVSAAGTNIVATCTLTVAQDTQDEGDALTLNRTSISLYPGESFHLKVASGSNGTPSWKSSNEALATVDANGRVYAHSMGTVTITATEDGKSASCVLTVMQKNAPQTKPSQTQPSSSQQPPTEQPPEPSSEPQQTETVPSPSENTPEE